MNLRKEKQNPPSIVNKSNENFENENLNVTYKDYYFSNVITRASKTMLDCYNLKLEIKRTGTEG